MRFGPTQQVLLALLESGRLQDVARQCGSPQALYAHLGLTSGQFRSARDRLREVGYAFPSAVELFGPGGFARARQAESASTVVESNGNDSFQIGDDFDGEEPTNPGVHPDIPSRIRPPVDPPLDAVPQGFVVREVATGVDANGKTEKQWIGARQEGERYEVIQPAMPLGHMLRGVSTLVDESGNVRAQWIKTNQTAQQYTDALLAALPSLLEPYRGKAERIETPTDCDDDLLVKLVIGDAHIGAYVWADECGQSFDLEIAERNMCTAIDHLVASAPNARRALGISVGDWFHVDSAANTTTAGTRQDVDTRWSKVLRVGMRVGKYFTDALRSKFERVEMKFVPGNHDASSSVAMAVAMAMFYENDPRVTIDQSPSAFLKYRFGKNLIVTCHGHTLKLEKIPGVMACDFAQDWGETEHREAVVGHVHHSQVKEFPGCIVETVQTLVPKDAWHAAAGYRSNQSMLCDVHHRLYGRIQRNTIGVRQVDAINATRAA